jgi:hypothetical protein
MENLRFITNEYVEVVGTGGQFLGDYLENKAKELKPKDRWGNINSIRFQFYDLEKQMAVFNIDCEGHGGFIIYADRGTITNTKEYKEASCSFYSNDGNKEMVFFEEDCDYSLGYNLLDKQQREIIEDKRLKRHEEIEKLTNNYTEYKPLSHYVKETIKHYYPNIKPNF